MSTLYMRRYTATQIQERMSAYLLNDDGSDEGIGLQVPHADIPVLTASIYDIFSCDKGENGAVGAFDSIEEFYPVGKTLPHLWPRHHGSSSNL
jgi:hypothetical protein